MCKSDINKNVKVSVAPEVCLPAYRWEVYFPLHHVPVLVCVLALNYFLSVVRVLLRAIYPRLILLR